ncbi:rhodanese-like domain-containing protein [Labilibacter marinus]|uniref:rhodanese-like domain-containing protein n=1 Tax=Labilibacter marinus TaxID=1477105 RepID=UPI000831FCF3|nr:rhodanese-like domain-containing protein [Labilibacter marinus]
MENKITVIDVRTPMEYAGGKVEGSINIPVDQIAQRIEEIRAIEGDIVLCCASGMRSFSALQFLEQNGMTNVKDGGPWYTVAN